MPSEPEKYFDGRDESVRTVFLLPSIDCDARAFVPRALSPSASAAMAAAEFLIYERGLPLDMVDVESQGRVYTVKSAPEISRCEILVPKCKLICSNLSVLYEKTEISVSKIVDESGSIYAVRCDDAECFSLSVLKRIALEFFDPDAIFTVAFSTDENEVNTKIFEIKNDPDMKTHAAVAVARAMGVGTVFESVSVKCGGVKFRVCDDGSYFAVSSQSPKPLTFFAPSI